MAIVVEDGTGLSTADSYISVADADTYHTNHQNSTDWSGASTANKEKGLRLAGQYLDAVYGGRWYGRRISETQGLTWPRYNVVDYDGYYLKSDEVPQAVSDAACELAVRQLSETNGLYPDSDTTRNVVSEKIKVGSIEEELKYAGTKKNYKTYRIVERLIAPLIKGAGAVERA